MYLRISLINFNCISRDLRGVKIQIFRGSVSPDPLVNSSYLFAFQAPPLETLRLGPCLLAWRTWQYFCLLVVLYLLRLLYKLSVLYLSLVYFTFLAYFICLVYLTCLMYFACLVYFTCLAMNSP